MKYQCAGMIVCDLPIYPVPYDIMQIENCLIDTPTITTGGDALNVARTLRILGAPDVSISGLMGKDAFGVFVRNSMTESGIGTENLLISDMLSTSVSFHLIDKDGRTHSIYHSSVNSVVDSEHYLPGLKENPDILYFGSALYFPRMDDGGIEKLFSAAHQQGVVTAMDTSLNENHEPGEVCFKRLEPALRQTDIFIPSLSEVSFMTGETDPHRIALRFADLGHRVFGTKLGKEGSYLTDFKRAYRISAFTEFPAIDTVGAGDSFMGSFLYAYGQGWDLEQCISLASVVSSFNVSALGATGGVPDIGTALDYLKKHPARITSDLF